MQESANLLEALHDEYGLTEVSDNGYLVTVQTDLQSEFEMQLVCSQDFISIGIPFADISAIEASKLMQATMNSPFGISMNGNGKYIVKHLMRNQDNSLDQFKAEVSMILANIQLWSNGEVD